MTRNHIISLLFYLNSAIAFSIIELQLMAHQSKFDTDDVSVCVYEQCIIRIRIDRIRIDRQIVWKSISTA